MMRMIETWEEHKKKEIHKFTIEDLKKILTLEIMDSANKGGKIIEEVDFFKYENTVKRSLLVSDDIYVMVTIDIKKER